MLKRHEIHAVFYMQLIETKFFRKCPKCNETLFYKYKKSHTYAINKNSLCLSCKNSGELNGNYGKKHSQECKDLISLEKKKYYLINDSHMKNKKHKQETKDKISKANKGKLVGELNPNFGKTQERSVWWNRKHTKQTREKMSISAINNMNGHSIGVKGTYKDIFFRSCLELSYIIYLTRFKIEFEIEPRLGITYLEYGIVKNYIPDFLICDKYLVEIKPKEFQDKPKNLLKTKAAIEYCKQHNLKYKIIQPKLVYRLMAKEYLSGNIVLSEKDKDKFLRKFKSKNKKLLEK
jgi:uncharacterized protein YbaR (Trm112 family)